MSRQKFEEAEKAFQKVALIEPDFEDAYWGLGLSRMSLKKYELAVSSFQRVIQLQPRSLDPRYKDIYYFIGCGFDLMGNYGSAAENLKKSIEINPEKLEVYEALGLSLASNGQIVEARAALKNFLARVHVAPAAERARIEKFGLIAEAEKNLRLVEQGKVPKGSASSDRTNEMLKSSLID